MNEEISVGEKFLPIGTVVMLKGGTKRAMITGFCSVAQEDTTKMYDYSGCIYPEGYISSNQVCLFDHEQIEKVYYKGLVDDEEKAFKEKLNTLLGQVNVNEMLNSQTASPEDSSTPTNNVPPMPEIPITAPTPGMLDMNTMTNTPAMPAMAEIPAAPMPDMNMAPAVDMAAVPGMPAMPEIPAAPMPDMNMAPAVDMAAVPGMPAMPEIPAAPMPDMNMAPAVDMTAVPGVAPMPNIPEMNMAPAPDMTAMPGVAPMPGMPAPMPNIPEMNMAPMPDMNMAPVPDMAAMPGVAPMPGMPTPMPYDPSGQNPNGQNM